MLFKPTHPAESIKFFIKYFYMDDKLEHIVALWNFILHR